MAQMQLFIWVLLLELCFGTPISTAHKRWTDESRKAFARMQQHQLVFHPLPLLYARVDPIVSPGVERTSGHMHTFIGPNNINSASTSDDLRNAECTSLTLGNKLDMSSYWQPSIYHRNRNGEHTLLKMESSSVYYNMETNVTKMIPFPDDFSMLVGNTTADVNRGPVSGYITSKFGDTGEFPRAYTPQIGIHLQFPDCHDGKPFTPENQDEHMVSSYKSNCPDGWVKYPAIMLQFTYSTGSEEDFPANPPGHPTYVLSNGDVDGSTIHGDFMNGWKSGVLKQVIDQCSDLGFGNTAECPIFKLVMGREVEKAAARCRYDLSVPDEEIGFTKPIKVLPGQEKVKTSPCNVAKLPVKFVQATTYVNSSHPQGYPEWPIA